VTAAKDEPLRRDIGFLGSAFLSFNGMVGAGIFALPEKLYSQFGAFSPFLFPLFGLLVLVIAIPFARMAALHPVSGGPVVYAASFGRTAAFQAGWIYYVARASALAAIRRFSSPTSPAGGRVLPIRSPAARSSSRSAPPHLHQHRRGEAGGAVPRRPHPAQGGTAAPRRGARPGDGRRRIEPPGPPPPLTQLETAALLILYAFVGFENSVTPAGETANPQRTIPRALLATIGGTALLYFLVQLSYVAVMEPGAGGDAPMVAFGTVLMGAAGGLLLVAATVFSLLGNISGGLTGTSRTSYAMGRDGLLPAWFGRVSARYATPANSIAFMGALIAVLALSSSFVWLAVVSVLARMFVYSISIASWPNRPRSSRRKPGPRAAKSRRVATRPRLPPG
jgi:amino acid transporter